MRLWPQPSHQATDYRPIQAGPIQGGSPVQTAPTWFPFHPYRAGSGGGVRHRPVPPFPVQPFPVQYVGGDYEMAP